MTNRVHPTRRRVARSGRRAAGLTLVEVVASVALLGVLLVGLLTTRSKLMHQWSLAQRKKQAIVAADALLANWWGDVAEFPRSGSGKVADSQDLLWRTRPIENRQVEELNGRVIQLDIFVGDFEARHRLTSVHVVLGAEGGTKIAEEADEGVAHAPR